MLLEKIPSSKRFSSMRIELDKFLSQSLDRRMVGPAGFDSEFLAGNQSRGIENWENAP
jgi:hypothetical protein